MTETKPVLFEEHQPPVCSNVSVEAAAAWDIRVREERMKVILQKVNCQHVQLSVKQGLFCQLSDLSNELRYLYLYKYLCPNCNGAGYSSSGLDCGCSRGAVKEISPPPPPTFGEPKQQPKKEKRKCEECGDPLESFEVDVCTDCEEELEV